jgi:hypothetical protein
VKEIQNCSNKKPGPVQSGDNYINKNRVRSFENILLKNHMPRKTQIYMTASRHSGDSGVFK